MGEIVDLLKASFHKTQHLIWALEDTLLHKCPDSKNHNVFKVLFTDRYNGKTFVYEFCVLCTLVNRLYTVIHNTQNS